MAGGWGAGGWGLGGLSSRLSSGGVELVDVRQRNVLTTRGLDLDDKSQFIIWTVPTEQSICLAIF